MKFILVLAVLGFGCAIGYAAGTYGVDLIGGPSAAVRWMVGLSFAGSAIGALAKFLS